MSTPCDFSTFLGLSAVFLRQGRETRGDSTGPMARFDTPLHHNRFGEEGIMAERLLQL